MMHKCDVIIPIYNAFTYVQKCIDTVIKNTDLSIHTLLLIDDKSPDKKILPYLESIIEEYPELNIKLIKNEKNKGFVATVNIGMRYSKNDVVLLNSDTEVPPRWLDNMIEGAYSQPRVASVTAMSNNATLVSVPIGLQVNELPSHMSFNEYAEMIEKISFKSYPELPSGHGFCMLIRREALDEVGYFDEEAFGKGYGEENDFSYRCLDYGFKHILCDNVIVFHKESQSFNEEKEALINNNLKILKSRYMFYVEKLDKWLHRFPIQHICSNIYYNTMLNKRPNVLFIIHDWKNVKENLGGTTLHCLDLIMNLKKDYNFHVLAPEDGIYKIYSYFDEDERVLELDGIYNSSILNTYNAEYKQLVKKVVKGLKIDTIHIHHLIGHYFDIIDVAKDDDIQTMITLHDFYSLCPTINMLFNMKEYCLPIENRNCKECLKNKMGITNNIIDSWQSQWKNFLNKVDTVIVPSNSTKEIIEETLEGITCLVMEHGIDIEKHYSHLKIEEGKDFNVAFVGVMAVHKGANVVKYLVDNTKNKHIKYHLFGTSEIDSLTKDKGNYTFHGRYKREDLANLLNQNNINIVCNLSIWPETYSYTLTETISSGIPVLSYDLGAVAERIKRYNFGWVLPPKVAPIVILRKLEEILDSPEKYNEVIRNINKYEVPTVLGMIQKYMPYYDKVLKEYDNIESLKELITTSNRSRVVGGSTELDRILNSRRWKLVSKIELPSFMKVIAKKIIK